MSFLLGLDAGHGLKTPGKRTPDGIHEWTLNNNVCLEIQRLLSTYDVTIIRLDDTTGKTDKPLLERIGLATDKEVDACVSIHHNAGGPKATGVEVLVHPTPTEQSITLAKQVLMYFSSYTGLRNRGLKNSTAFTMVGRRSFATILCEGGFMDGENDTKVIRTKAYYTAYAKAVVKALVDIYKIKKKPIVATPSTNKKYGIAASNLVLRKEDKQSSEQLEIIPKGKKILIVKEGISYHQVKVTLNNKVYSGYASARYIKL
jgi:N-acetylmuramoyl-L-alanine amidase